MAKGPVPNRRYTDEYKQEALRLAETVGINQAAQRLGMPASSLGNWMRRKRSGKLPAMSAATPMKGSPAELEAENAQCRSRAMEQPKPPFQLPQQQHAAIAGDFTTTKFSDDLTALERRKLQLRRVTIWHRRNP